MPKVTNEFDCDVLIVGGGPVGIGLAIELGQRGVSVIVLERSVKLHSIPRGQNLTQRTGEHFRAWKVLDGIEEATPIPRSFGNAGLVAYGSLLGDFSYDWMRRGSVGDYYFAPNQRLPQYETEKVLRARVASFDNVSVHFGSKVLSVSQNDEGANVTFEKDDQDGTLQAQYVIGCDGSRSIVRESAVIEQDIDPHDRKMVLLVFNSTELHDILERFPGKSVFNVLNPELDGYWQFLGRVDLDGNWFYHAPVPAETTLDNFDFKAYLHQAMGTEFAIDFHHIGFWDLRIAMAKSYRNGRLFIAGDAAHSHPPYGGYGVNTGLEDVRNLGWKLAAVLDGWGTNALLDSYDEERRPVFASTSQDFIGKMIEDDRAFLKKYNPERNKAEFESAWKDRAEGGNDSVTRFVPNYSSSPIVIGGEGKTGAQDKHMMDARAGHHLAPAKLSGGRDLFDQMEGGYSLLCFGPKNDVHKAFEAAAESLNVPLTVIADEDSEALKTYAIRFILVRPDHFIAWTGDDAPRDPEAILQVATGRRLS